MRWFYELKRSVRTVIAIVAWLPLVIFAAAISPSIGENGENMQTWQAVLVLLFLAIPAFFDTLAIIARVRESKAKKAQQAAHEPSPAADPRPTQHESRTPPPVPVYSDKPDAIVRLIRNGNDDMQANLSYCTEGDEVEFDYDYDKGLCLCTSDGLDIGYLPEKVGFEIDDNAIGKIEKIDFDGDKYHASVAIFSPVKISVKFHSGVTLPRHTKAVGVTFGDCQAHIAQSQQGDVLTFKHAPLPQYPESTDIINERTGACVGRVNADLARALVEEFGDGFVLVGAISEITGGGEGKNLGCNVIIEGVK